MAANVRNALLVTSLANLVFLRASTTREALLAVAAAGAAAVFAAALLDAALLEAEPLEDAELLELFVAPLDPDLCDAA